MAKSSLPSVIEIKSELKSKIIKPIYFLCGDDSFGIHYAFSEIKKSVEKIISSDFDIETYYASDKELSLAVIISAAKTFPFGDGKKLIIIKDADEIKFSSKDETFLNYIKNPSDFTVLVFLYEGKISNSNSEPFKSLIKNQFLYESSQLRADSLVKWLIQFVEDKDKKISKENASLLIDIVGESRNVIENQIDKLIEYIGEEPEISFKAIQELATKLKTHTIFDLFNSIDKGDSESSLKIAYNLLENSNLGIIGIIAMLNKHFTALLRIEELEKSGLTKEEKAKITGTHPFYYQGLVNAYTKFGAKKIINALDAIYKADVQVKSTSIDEKTILSILIAEILLD